jgi:hypothetical protein
MDTVRAMQKEAKIMRTMYVEMRDRYEEISERYEATLAKLAERDAAVAALAPDWSEAPEWAQWYCVEPGDATGAGFARWWAHDPVLNGKEWTPTIVLEGGYSATLFAGHIDLYLGIDWRLCKWQRPVTEVTK